MAYFLNAIMPVCDEYGIDMCVHPDDPPMPILGLPRIVTCDADIRAFLDAVPNPHNGLTFCAGSLSAGATSKRVKIHPYSAPSSPISPHPAPYHPIQAPSFTAAITPDIMPSASILPWNE